MARFLSLMLPAAAALALAACERPGAGNDAAAADANSAAAADGHEAPAVPSADYPADIGIASNAQDKVATSLNAEGVFKGWEAGDHLWAQFDLPGHEAEDSALVDSTKIAAFLNAHKGKKISVRLDTVNTYLDPPGERMDVTKVREARIGDENAAAWWEALSPEQQRAAADGVAKAMGSGGG